MRQSTALRQTDQGNTAAVLSELLRRLPPRWLTFSTMILLFLIVSGSLLLIIPIAIAISEGREVKLSWHDGFALQGRPNATTAACKEISGRFGEVSGILKKVVENDQGQLKQQYAHLTDLEVRRAEAYPNNPATANVIHGDMLEIRQEIRNHETNLSAEINKAVTVVDLIKAKCEL